MLREHLIAGTRERVTGRAHHPDQIPGYTGDRKGVRHGQPYPSIRTGLIEYHGLTDNLSGPDHARAIEAANRRLAVGTGRHYQKMTEEYKKPPTGY